MNFYLSPVVKFTPDGEGKAVYSLNSVPGWEGGDIYNFAVGHDGQVYLLAGRLDRKKKKVEFAIVTMNDQGGHRFTTTLKAPFDAVEHVGVFSSGEMVIWGHREIGKMPEKSADRKDWGKRNVEPVTTILDRNGNLVKELELSLDSIEGETSGDGQRSVGINSVSLGSVTMGDDGALYLMYRGKRPDVHVINAEGEIVRTLKITPPSERAVAMEIANAAGMGLMVKFGEKGEGTSFPGDKTVFSLIDRQTGERLYDYQSSMRLGPALACYTAKGFLFVGSSKGQFALLRAVAK
jgi:hypothetical protein